MVTILQTRLQKGEYKYCLLLAYSTFPASITTVHGALAWTLHQMTPSIAALTEHLQRPMHRPTDRFHKRVRQLQPPLLPQLPQPLLCILHALCSAASIAKQSADNSSTLSSPPSPIPSGRFHLNRTVTRVPSILPSAHGCPIIHRPRQPH